MQQKQKLIQRGRVWLSILFFAVLFCVPMSHGFAQESGQIRGLTITPFLIELQLEKGQTVSKEIELINTNPFPIVVNPEIKDFLPEGENGQQTFFEPGKGDPTFSLSSWIKLENPAQINLKPKDSIKFKFDITPPQTAENGGHYGAILFSFQGVGIEGSSVAVTQKIGTIVLVKLGKAIEDGNIVNFSTEKGMYEYPPITFTTKFKNTGNVHVKPRGSVTIYNSFGKKVGLTKVNENGNNVLPNSERVFKSEWEDTYAFGRYTADEKLTFGDGGQLVTSQTSFWVIPWRMALGLIIGLFILGIILVAGTRRYNKWIIQQAEVAQFRQKRAQSNRIQKSLKKARE